MAITRKQALRIGLYGSAGVVVLLVLLNPYARQSLFGPKIADLPLCYWQDSFRRYADPNADRDSLTTRVFRWLGFNRRDNAWGLPEKKADMLPVLLSLADDPQPRVRAQVAHNLDRGYEPDACEPALVRLLDDREPKVRAVAAHALGNVKPPVERALPRLVALLDDGDTGCRVQAARAVWLMGQKQHEKLVPILRQGLSDPDGMTRIEAARMLGQLGNDAADAFAEIAVCATTDPHLAVRAEATDTLGRFGPAAVPVLTKVLQDTNPAIREHAARALGSIGPVAKEAVPALQVLLNDSSYNTRDSAIEALHRIDPEQFPPLKARPQ